MENTYDMPYEDAGAGPEASAETQAEETQEEEAFQGTGTLGLKKPLMLDGREVRELPYDFDALTTKDVIDADTERTRSGGNPVYVDRFDPAFKLRLFARAVGKKLPTCTYEDLLRLSMRDGSQAMGLSMRFLSESSKDGEA